MKELKALFKKFKKEEHAMAYDEWDAGWAAAMRMAQRDVHKAIERIEIAEGGTNERA